MDEYVTIQQAMQILHRSEPVVRGYIKSGKLSGERSKADGKYYMLRSDVEQMAKNPAQIQTDKLTAQLVKMNRQLEEMEARLKEVETRLETFTSQPVVETSTTTSQPRKKQPQPHTTTASDKSLPDGAILASVFAKAHGVVPRTFADQCKYGKGEPKELAPVSSRPKPGREHLDETEYYILPEQVAGVLDYWRRHYVPFQEPQDET